MKQLHKFGQVALLGSIIFAILFGAGNLVLPPMLGYESASNFTPTIIGFLIMAVGLPTLSITAFASVEGKPDVITDKISKKFTLFYVSIIYILIGPAFAIPRTAVVSYELAVTPFISSKSNLLLLFSIVYFIIALICCLYSSKAMQFIGKYIMPILLILIIAIIIGAILSPISSNNIPNKEYANSPFIKGMLNGFLTMDALGGIIVVNTVINKLKEMNITESSEVVKNTIYAGILAGAVLCALYVGLGYIGYTSDPNANFSNGGGILIASVIHSFGMPGTIALIITILIACFTTCFTLILGFSEYFHSIFPNIPYKSLVLMCTFFSFVVSNLGFNLLMALATPVLNIMYPITIVVIALTIFKKHVNRSTSIVSISLAGILSTLYVIFDVLKKLSAFTINLPYSNLHNIISSMTDKYGTFIDFFSFIPLFDKGLGWILPTLVISVITQIITKNK